MKLRLSTGLISLCLLGVIGCQTTAEITPTHMLRLLCEGADQRGVQSRIAVLDIGDSDYDYGFTTGHGVPPERPCEVRDFNGKSRPVNSIRLADGYKSGAKTDWAIIKFEKISTKGLVRYELKPIENLSHPNQNQIHFARAYGLPKNAQPCNLSILDFKNGNRRASHDCRSIPGQSGSPITQLVDGKHKLVGLHIGQVWMFDSPETGRPDRKGYINLLDRDTIKEIEDIILTENN